MELKEEFCKLFREIIDSNDERKMQVLGSVVKKMMNRYIETAPTQAKEYIEELEAVRWRNYLTQREAMDIVQLMVPKPKWTYNQWSSEMKNQEHVMVLEPFYNEWAMYVTMCMVCSDHGKTLDGLNTGFDLFEVCYSLARDLLMDEDAAFCIRKYFDV